MDSLIIGCGLTGAVIARYIAEKLNKSVVVWERRNTIAGNMYDYYDEYGILVHKYGPHVFHTNDENLYNYISKFGEWVNYKLDYKAYINGKYTPTPFNFNTIDDFYSKEDAEDLKKRIQLEFGNRTTATVLEVLNAKDRIIREYGNFLFEVDYKLYTAKQWGVSADTIDPSILRRVPLRFSYDVGYFDDKYQCMPKEGYTKFFENLLNHPNIRIELGVDAMDHITINENKNEILVDGKNAKYPIVYTGALDELFGKVKGTLPYRSLRFEWVHENIDSKQDAPVVAYPQVKDFTRITEYKKLPVQYVEGTTYAVEYPLPYDSEKQMEPYYPVLTEESQKIYSLYREKADKINNLYCAGRLADFKYYNMDQALSRAFDVCNNIRDSFR